MSIAIAEDTTIRDSLIYAGHWGLCYLMIVLLILQYWVIAFITGGSRRKIFTDDHMRKFETQHREATGKAPPKGGYPDMGNGVYSRELDYDKWFKFNNNQRAHYNYLEHLLAILVWTYIGSFRQPLPAAVIAFVYMVGRIAYTIGYFKTPNARGVGAIIIDIAFVAQFALSIAVIIMW